jgi:DNA polymerase III sliding clamp (beta) subunit (PCNA family)
MKWGTKMIKLEQAQKIAKPFVSKSATRPILTAALVKNGLLTATDAHRLIRIKTDIPKERESLVHYSDYTEGYDSTSYPQTDRLMPDPHAAKETFKINVKEWLKIHKEALAAAKEHDSKLITLNKDTFHVKPLIYKAVKAHKSSYSSVKGMKGYKDVRVPEEEQKEFTHTLDVNALNESVTYNCKYMIEALTAFNKLRIKEVTLHFYSPMRPFVLTGENVEILILPVRIY